VAHKNKLLKTNLYKCTESLLLFIMWLAVAVNIVVKTNKL